MNKDIIQSKRQEDDSLKNIKSLNIYAFLKSFKLIISTPKTVQRIIKQKKKKNTTCLSHARISNGIEKTYFYKAKECRNEHSS